MRIDAHVWQFGVPPNTVDYPGLAGSDDSKLPLKSINLKAWDERWWMSNFDPHAAAVSGPAQIARLVKTYGDQGIELLLWCVPKGRDVARQLSLAKACVDVPGVEGLVFDVEPYSGFCAGDCPYLAGTLMKQLRAARPNTWLGVTYDPRSQHWDSSGTRAWLQYADGALPMVYFDTFAGQGDWADPTRAVRKAHTDLRQSLAPGRSIEYFPILQGAASASRIKAGLVEAVRLGSTRISVWRRGIVAPASWSAIASVPEPTPPPPPPPPTDPCVDVKAELAACQTTVASLRRTVASLEADIQGRDAHIADLNLKVDQLGNEIDRLRGELSTCMGDLVAYNELIGALSVLKKTIVDL